MAERRPLKIGLVGATTGFIAQAHHRAILMDGTRRVAATALSSDPAKALDGAANWPYPVEAYKSYDAMLAGEIRKPKDERIDYVLIVTPNRAHFDPARKFLEVGIPVFCEKPLTITSQESEILCALVDAERIPFGVAHTYIGHWTSWLARHIVGSGLLGNIRWVDASYLQAWVAVRSGQPGFKENTWRINPNVSGISNCGGDIGTHALMQLRFVTGLDVRKVSAYLETFIPVNDTETGHLDDHFTAYCELDGGAKGLVRASQIAVGHKNDLRLEVNGDKGSLRWDQEESDKLSVYPLGQPERTYYRGLVAENDGFLEDLPKELLQASILPPGHREGLHDAFARLHRAFEADVRAWQAGNYTCADGSRYATVKDGLAGIRFVEKAVESNRNDHCWVNV